MLKTALPWMAEQVRRTHVDQWWGIGPVIRSLGRWANQMLFRADGVPATVDGEVSIRLSPRAFSGGHYGFDPKLVKELRQLARPGRHFLDAGAHKGICSLLYAQFAGPGTRVAAFEPNPFVLDFLVENLRVNRWEVELYRAALGDRVGTVPFYFDQDDPNASLSSEAPGKYWYWENRAKPVMRSCRVPMTTIDAFSKSFDFEPGVIKLDVEGAELPALRGAEETLQRCRPWIILETHVFAWESFGYRREDLEGMIRRHRYDILDQEGKLFTGELGTGPQRDNNHYLLRPQ